MSQLMFLILRFRSFSATDSNVDLESVTEKANFNSSVFALFDGSQVTDRSFFLWTLDSGGRLP